MQLTKQIKGGDDMEIKVIGTPDEIKRNTEPLTGDGEKR